MRIFNNRKLIVLLLCLTILLLVGLAVWKDKQTRFTESFKAPGNNWQSTKKIEDYFVNDMRMTPEEAKRFADIGVSFYVTKNTTIDGIIGNLAYYGVVKDQNTLKYALEHTKDIVPGKDGAIKVGSNGTIDLAVYGLSRNMDTWQIADALLNKPHYVDLTQYNYLFMPGDPNAKYGDRTQGN